MQAEGRDRAIANKGWVMETEIRSSFALAVTLSLAVLAIGFVPLSASAQTRTFLYVDGIRGGSIDPGHRDWIDVAGLRQTYPVNQNCELQIVKPLDVAGPKMWGAAVTGEHFKKAVIEVMTYVEGRDRRLYQVQLNDVIFTSIVDAGGPNGTWASTAGGMVLAETVTMLPRNVVIRFYVDDNVVEEQFNCPSR